MKGRSVVEIMALTFTFTVAFAIVATGAVIAILEIRDPTVDTTRIVESLTSVISGILGALLGLLAGKNVRLDTRPDGTSDELHPLERQ